MEKSRIHIANGVQYYFGGDYGSIFMVEPKTISRFHELHNQQPDADKYGVFFAFSKEQFKKGYDSMVRRGYIKDGDKIKEGPLGMYGTEDEIHRFYEFYEERNKKIAQECDPQEVYFYEWNNHEVCISCDDDEAMRCIIDYFGKEAAHKVERVYAGTPINVLAPLTTRDEHLKQYEHSLMMLGRLSFDCGGFFSEGDCRYHRPECLWAGNIKKQVEEMRKLYNGLPDDIKDESCMSKEKIEDYGKRFEQWADEEFAKDIYNPVPPTPRSKYKGYELALGYKRLRYKDEDGKWQTPDHVWFSNDTRRCHQDKSCVAGRCFTSYLGKKGTTLTRVYIDTDSMSFEPYTLPHLCDVSAKYNPDYRQNKLYDFYHE